MNDDKVVNLRHERDRAMDLAKQAAKKLQVTGEIPWGTPLATGCNAVLELRLCLN